MGSTLTVLGCSGSYFDSATDVPCSGYLLEYGPTRLLLDCGHGVYQRNRTLLRSAGLTAAVISHSHGDHIGDLPYLVRDNSLWQNKPTLVANSATIMTFLQAEDLEAGVVVREAGDGAEVTVADLSLCFSETIHTVPTVACSISAPSGEVVLFTADTGPGWIPPPSFRRADLVLVECTLAERTVEPAGRFHLAPADVVNLIQAVDARSVVVTHVPPGQDAARRRSDIQAHVGCTVSSATVGLTLDL